MAASSTQAGADRLPHLLPESDLIVTRTRIDAKDHNAFHNADAGLLDRYVQSSKMAHAALLLPDREGSESVASEPAALLKVLGNPTYRQGQTR